MTATEQKEFLDKLEGSEYKYLMLFYLFTGVRRNEALLLEWSDIDDRDELIRIRGTKTENSYRNILLTDDVRRILEGQKELNRQKNYSGSHVFPPRRPETISVNFKRLCGKHHLHDLRHTFITRCAESGVNINVCQQLVGHSTPLITMSVYTHVMDDFKRKEAAKFTINPMWK